MSTTREYVSVTDTAKMLRKALKAAHPGVKFSVKSRKYAGGASIDVGWTDGPTEDDVKRTTRLYTGASFDGMRDLMEYHDTVLVGADGSIRDVHFAANFIFTHRELSPAVVAAAAAFIAGLPSRRSTCGDEFMDCRGYRCDRGIRAIKRGDPIWLVKVGNLGRANGVTCSPECAARHDLWDGRIRPSAKGGRS